MGYRLTSAGLLGAIAACLILASCTNADGNTSSGMTAPVPTSVAVVAILDLRVIPLSFLGGLTIGALGGLAAAQRAAKVNPADALRM